MQERSNPSFGCIAQKLMHYSGVNVCLEVNFPQRKASLETSKARKGRKRALDPVSQQISSKLTWFVKMSVFLVECNRGEVMQHGKRAERFLFRAGFTRRGLTKMFLTEKEKTDGTYS